MKLGFVGLLALGLFAGIANILGGLILLPTGTRLRLKPYLKYLLAFGAGFMLAVTFVEIIPETMALWQKGNNSAEDFLMPTVLLLAGYLLTQFFEHTIAPHIHLGEEVHSDHLISVSSVYTAIGGILIHTFFDGVSIAAAAQVNFNLGVLVFLAIFLHKFPEGFTVASLILASGKGYREVLFGTALVGLTTLIGVIAFLLIGNNLGLTVAYALPLASGVMLYVAASDLIPEVNHHGGKRPLVTFFVFGGVALCFLLHYLLHGLLEAEGTLR